MMKYSNILLATAAIGAMVGTAVPAVAQAKASSSTASSAQAEEIRALRAQLEALTARLDAQEAAQQGAQAENAMLSAQVEAAQESAAAANEAAEKAAKVDFKPYEWAKKTKISGRMYFNISSVDAETNGVNREKQGGFQIKRFYIGVDHKFDDIFSGNVTMDIDNVADTTGKLVGKGFYVKKAYLKAKLDPAFSVALGAIDLPWIPYAEGIYGYRHLEKTTSDLFSYGTSADWGVHVSGDLADGLISYQVSAVDGAGYREPKFTKTIDLEGRVALKYKGFNAAIGGYTGKLGSDVQGAAFGDVYRTATRFNALLAYKDKIQGVPVTIGGEYFYAENWKVKNSAAEDKAEGYSVFASVVPMDKWSVFGRYDWIKPSKTLAPTKKGNYWNLGVQYSPAKIVDLALMYKRYDADNSFKGGDFSYGSFVEGKRDEFGLFGQFRF